VAAGPANHGANIARRRDSRNISGAVFMSPIRLTDEEMNAVFIAAGPIPLSRRDQFLQDVAKFLRGCAEVGPGHVHRAIAEAQRAHFDPPVLDSGRMPRVSKWER